MPSHENSIKHVIHYQSIFIQNNIQDMHIILYKFRFYCSASLYKPTITTNPIAIVCEPFSIIFGISICNAKTSYFEGTAGFFFINPVISYILFFFTASEKLKVAVFDLSSISL